MLAGVFGGDLTLLQWGAVGLSALTLLLVLFTLFGKIGTGLKAVWLGFAVIVGAACFGAAVYIDTLAKSGVALSLLPAEADDAAFPAPVITADGAVLDLSTPQALSGAQEVEIDISAGADAFAAMRAQADDATATVAAALATADEAKGRAAAAEAALAAANAQIETMKLRSAEELAAATAGAGQTPADQGWTGELTDVQLAAGEKDEALAEAHEKIAVQTDLLDEALQSSANLSLQVEQLRVVLGNVLQNATVSGSFNGIEQELTRFNDIVSTAVFEQ